MKQILLALTVLAVGHYAQATSTRTLTDDSLKSSDLSKTWTMPSITDTLVGLADSGTLTNKTISGANNTISNLAASVITSGQLGVANGGTGAATLTTNGIVYGNGTSAVGITAAGSQYQVYQAGASGVPTVGALNLGQAAAVTGQLPVASGGTGASTLTAGSVVVGNGSSAVSLVAPSTSGNVLTSNGSTWVSQAVSSAAPALNSSAATPQSVTAAGGISLAGQTYVNVAFIKSNSGSVTVTATPSITACSYTGEMLYIVGEDATNIITLQDNANLAGSKLQLNGNWTSGLNKSLTLICDLATTGNWVELARSL
jgi:hypothetical protein